MLPRTELNHTCKWDKKNRCGACLEIARDKQWAEWFINSGDCVLLENRKIRDDAVNSAPVVMIAPRCFEALKKLAEGK